MISPFVKIDNFEHIVIIGSFKNSVKMIRYKVVVFCRILLNMERSY